jgi:hypothetical protein
MSRLQLAPGLYFPAAELATEVIASLANRGGGKSNGAAVIVEGFLRAEIPVVVLDYVGIWPSLRLKADGKTPSEFAIPVLGGPHGDIPLSPSAGAVVAEALAEGHSSAVLDVSSFSKADRCRFATDFAEAFFRAKKKHPGPVQLVLEEAQRYIPQRLFHGMERMVGAFTEIAEVGRNYGIGLHLISQRPQKIDKDVLNLADTLFVYRTMGLLERKAIAEWVQEKGAEGRATVSSELPGLRRGEAFVWSPSRDVYGKYQIFKKTTYDAGATPLQARASMKPKPIDLGVLKVAMEKVVEEVKANDPAALRSEVSRLKRALGEAEKKQTTPVQVVDNTATKKAISEVLAKVRSVEMALEGWIAGELKRVTDLAKGAHEALDACLKKLDVGGEEVPQQVAIPSPGSVSFSRGTTYRMAPAVRKVKTDGDLSRCAEALITTLAHRKTANASQLAVLSGYSRKSSGFDMAVRELKVAGYMMGEGARYEVTPSGREYVGDVGFLPQGKELLDYWKGRLGRCESALLQWVYDLNSVSRSDLAVNSGYSLKSSGFDGAVSTLQSLGLIQARRERGEESILCISPDFAGD